MRQSGKISNNALPTRKCSLPARSGFRKPGINAFGISTARYNWEVRCKMAEDSMCSSSMFRATMGLNLALLVGNGLVLGLLAWKLLRRRSRGMPDKLGGCTTTTTADYYEPSNESASGAVRARVEAVKGANDESLYHVPNESAYVNENSVRKNLSYLEVK